MRKRLLTTIALAAALVAGACRENQTAGPLATVPQQSRGNLTLAIIDGVEYEMDTGAVACPAVLNSNVRFFVRMNGVAGGGDYFTFLPPHRRIAYLDNGVYRFRMTLGKSDNGEWLAEGAWTGKCFGYSQWGIGRVISFEGTVWRADSRTSCGGSSDPDNPVITDPLSAPPSDPDGPEKAADSVAVLTTSPTTAGDCSGGGGGGSGGSGCTATEIQVSYDGGRTWTTIYQGNVCEAS